MIRSTLPVLVLASAFLAGPRGADAAILQVDCLGGPFFNINAAVAAAVPGDTIVVHVCFAAPGTYPPFAVGGGLSSVRIVAADAFLPYVGAQRLGVTATVAGFAPPVIVDGTGVAGPCASVTGATDIEITGFWLRNCGTHGVQVLSSDHVSITGNRIEATAQAGIRVSDTGYEDVRVVGNLVYHAARAGIALMGGNHLYVTDNTVLGAGREGIYVDVPATAVELVNNNVTGGQKEGIFLRNAQGLIARNTSTANLVGGGACEINLDPLSAANSVVGNLTNGVAPGWICGALGANFVAENR
jgi:nitrous oxidase accessory protein NosD